MKALIIDDEESIRKTLGMVLSEKGYQVLCAADGPAGLRIIEESDPEILVLDIRLPGMDGLEVLGRARERSSAASVIMITAFQDMETTVQAMKLGAYEYIHKPIDLVEFETAIDTIAGSRQSSTGSHNGVTEISTNYKVEDIVGRTDCMKEIFKIMGLAAGTGTTVLIRGESGTGKELIARAIHRNSPRSSEPFVPVNCSTLVENLFESELFGHEKGSFTGAAHQKKGKIELAQSGTIFLDEVGDLPPAFQVKLLRFLQEREFERVGGEEILRSGARIITATNRDLKKLVAAGRFREDLYFRLNVLEIHVPPLRERKTDIPLLVEHLLNRINTTLGKQVTKIHGDVMDAILRYPWPGNVRELENVLTRSAVLCKGDVLLPDCLPHLVSSRPQRELAEGPIQPLDAVVNEHVRRALQFTNGHKGETCKLLGISRPTLRRIMNRPDFGRSA